MKKVRRVLIGIVTLVAAIVFCVTLARALFFAPEAEMPMPGGARVLRDLPPSEEPARLRIPSIGVDAHIQYVGVNTKGNMGVPSNYSDVAWYKYGTPPGQNGSAVIDGHVDNGLGLPGVFKRLGNVRSGDDIYIETKTGRVLHFKAVEIATYDYREVPLDKLFMRADAARLNLITCGGSWIKTEKTYDERVVVYTVLVGVTEA